MIRAENGKTIGSPPPINMKDADVHLINSKPVGSFGSSNNQVLA